MLEIVYSYVHHCDLETENSMVSMLFSNNGFGLVVFEFMRNFNKMSISVTGSIVKSNFKTLDGVGLCEILSMCEIVRCFC